MPDPMTHLSNRRTALATAAMAALLSGCSPSAADPEPAPTQIESSDAAEPDTVSILRPEIEPPEIKPTPKALGPYRSIIGFPEGGSALDAVAVAALEAALEAEQTALGLPITLRAHSDSQGTDTANLNASEKRGLAVAKWLINRGVDADRITVIALGEQNPAEPNALPDGAPNEKGRAANRRVELEIASVEQPADDAAAKPDAAPSKSIEAGD